MHRLPTPPKYHDGVETRALGKNAYGSKQMSFLDRMKSYVWPNYGVTTYQTAEHTNLFNLSYLGELYAGTPAQKFLTIWDTGSGSLLLRSSNCTSCPSGTRKLDISASSTYKE